MRRATVAFLLTLAVAGCATPSLNLITVVLPGGRMTVGQVNETKTRSDKAVTAGAVATTVIPGMDRGAAATTAAPAPWRPLN